jgi:hypothetical protein
MQIVWQDACVPAGQYRILDEHGDRIGTEAFRSAPGPVGWRYFSTVVTPEGQGNVDLSVDAAWKPVRVRVQSGAHHTLLLVRGDALTGVRDDEEVSHPIEATTDIEYPSPGFLAAAARRHRETVEVPALALDPATLQPLPEIHRYELIGPERVETSVGTFEATHWRFIAPRPRFTRSFWVAGDVCVAAEGLYELFAYEALSNGPTPVEVP